MSYEFFLAEKLLPKNFKYPNSYSKITDNLELDIEPWHFFYNYLNFRYEGLKKRYPKRVLIPFARRRDNDDVACFDGTDISGDPKVLIIHDWASPGWENRGEFENFLEWLEFAKEQSKEWKLLGGS